MCMVLRKERSDKGLTAGKGKGGTFFPKNRSPLGGESTGERMACEKKEHEKRSRAEKAAHGRSNNRTLRDTGGLIIVAGKGEEKITGGPNIFNGIKVEKEKIRTK